ncbi:MAG: hypothetical protein GQ533_14785 [Methanosarcinaceae archaeon]|jgi:chemotaxis protein CheC|nr:hypothetical protein [Methanosarcinaceae archaeon]
MEIGFNEFHYDALNEVGNIGMGNATTALSQLIGKRVRVSTPSLMVVDTESIIDRTKDIEVVGTIVKIVGDVNGGNMILYQKKHADMLADILLEGTDHKNDSEMKRSVLSEVCNILAGSYLNALSKFLDLTVLPSIPYQTEGSSADIFEMADSRLNCNIDHILALTTMFEVEDVIISKTIDGDMFMLLDSKSLDVILNTIDRMRTT